MIRRNQGERTENEGAAKRRLLHQSDANVAERAGRGRQRAVDAVVQNYELIVLGPHGVVPRTGIVTRGKKKSSNETGKGAENRGPQMWRPSTDSTSEKNTGMTGFPIFLLLMGLIG